MSIARSYLLFKLSLDKLHISTNAIKRDSYEFLWYEYLLSHADGDNLETLQVWNRLS